MKRQNSKWGSASGKSQKEGKSRRVGGVWPSASLLISPSYFNSSGSSPPHFSLSHSDICPPFCFVFRHGYSLLGTFTMCRLWKLKWPHFHCQEENNNNQITSILIIALIIKRTSWLLGARLNFQLARRSINKDPHGQTRLIKGPCVVKFCLVYSLASVAKGSFCSRFPPTNFSLFWHWLLISPNSWSSLVAASYWEDLQHTNTHTTLNRGRQILLVTSSSGFFWWVRVWTGSVCEHMLSKCRGKPWWSVVVHGPASVYFYMVKYTPADGWNVLCKRWTWIVERSSGRWWVKEQRKL